MTSRQRLQTVLSGGIPDCVPVAPDTSNMIPARLTGKPFWEIYLYRDPAPWVAYINCVKHFGFDSLMDGYANVTFDEPAPDPESKTYIVYRSKERVVTQTCREANGQRYWAETVDVYYVGDTPTRNINPHLARLPKIPDSFEPVGEVREWPTGEALMNLAFEMMGEQGLVGQWCGLSNMMWKVEDVYEYYDNPEILHKRRDSMLVSYPERFRKLMAMERPPDFICMGGSGSLIFQTPDVFRELCLPIVKKMSAMCKEAGIPSHIHSCGPQRELVKICAEETDLTLIDPLEIPPMGDCNLRELKRLYGHKLVLKGNLHTTDVMLRGSVSDVVEACKRAIDDAAEDGGFILSTGDQCGRDTPDENIYAMIETARTYGLY